MTTKSFPLLSTFKSFLAVTSLVTSIATAVVTAPVGYVKLTFNKEADTPFSIPMNRAKVFSGKISENSANTITIANDNFTASQFVYNDGSQNEHFYILFTSGTLEGRSFDIESNTLNTITVTQSSVDTTGTDELADLINNASSTDNFEIRPHWTLNTLFPGGEGVAKTTDINHIQSRIYFRDIMNGINIPIAREYIYFDSQTNDSLDGWYIPGDDSLSKQNDVVLKNETFYIMRNHSQQVHTPNITGDVPTVNFANTLRTNVISMDNYIAVSVPVELSLSESNLVGSGVFQATTDIGLRNGDTLLTFTYPATAFNWTPSGEYIYFDSINDDLDGWYIPGEDIPVKRNTEKIFKPGRAYIIRTTGAGRVDEKKTSWTTPLPYNPFLEVTP